MASSLAANHIEIFNDFGYRPMVDTFQQSSQLFGASSGGAITIGPQNFSGDVYEQAFLNNLIKDANTNLFDVKTEGTPSAVEMTEGLQRSVKLYFYSGKFKITDIAAEWNLRQVADYVTRMASLMGGALFLKHVNAAIAGARGALLANSPIDSTSKDYGGNIVDITGATKPGNTPAAGTVATWDTLEQAKGLFGDREPVLSDWVMHSKVWKRLVRNTLSTDSKLNVEFSYPIQNPVVTVYSDVLGVRITVIDDPSLILEKTFKTSNAKGNVYLSLCLRGGAVNMWTQGAIDQRVTEDTNTRPFSRYIAGEQHSAINVYAADYKKSTAATPLMGDLAAAGSWGKLNTLGIKDSLGVGVLSVA